MTEQKNLIVSKSSRYSFSTDVLLKNDSKVYKGNDKETGQFVAVKVIKNNNAIKEKNFGENIAAHLDLDSYEKRKNKQFKQVNIRIMEFCNGSVLHDILSTELSCRKGLNDEEFLLVLVCVYNSLKKLEENKIIHGDFTPMNIMSHVKDDGQKVFKLINLPDGGRENFETPKSAAYAWVKVKRAMNFDDSFTDNYTLSPDVDLQMAGVTLFYAATGRYPLPEMEQENCFTEDNFDKWESMIKDNQSCMWISQSENGRKHDFHEDLPEDCNLSRSLREHLQPLLSEMLSAKKQSTFKYFYDFVEKILQYKKLRIFFVANNQLETIYLCNGLWSALRVAMTNIHEDVNFDSTYLFYNSQLLNKDEPLSLYVKVPSAIQQISEDVPILTWLISLDTDIAIHEEAVEEFGCDLDEMECSERMRNYVKLAKRELHFDVIDNLIFGLADNLGDETKKLLDEYKFYTTRVDVMVAMCEENSSAPWNQLLHDRHTFDKYIHEYEKKLLSPTNGFVSVVKTNNRNFQFSRASNRHVLVENLERQLSKELLDFDSQTSEDKELRLKRCYNLLNQARDLVLSIQETEKILISNLKKCLKKIYEIYQRFDDDKKKINEKISVVDQLLAPQRSKDVATNGDALKCLSGLYDLMTIGKTLHKEIENLENSLKSYSEDGNGQS